MKRAIAIAVAIFGFSTSELAWGYTQGDAVADIAISNHWGNGYCADIAIQNQGSASITSWQVTLQLQSATINNMWNADYSANKVTPKDYNAVINPNQSVSFGFCASAPDGSSPKIADLSVTTYEQSSQNYSSSSASSLFSLSSQANFISSQASSVSSIVQSSSNGSASSTSLTRGECDGYATRFWDCCKPHCGWSANLPNGIDALPSCSISDQPQSSRLVPSSCNGGDAYMCTTLTPFAVTETLAYGFAATANGDICGRCYQLDFTGQSYNSPNDPGSAALNGKTMIVQAINIGYDVAGGQFDLLIPGGGVGIFNACSDQWGISSDELGAQYGGLLSQCKQEIGYNATRSQYKSCLINKCDNVFGARGLTEMQQGCRWHAQWLEAADNPALKYKEVQCPQEIIDRSTIDRRGLSDIRQSCNNL